MDSWLGLAVAVALVLLNGFFVATEFAIVKVRGTRLDELVKSGHGGARVAKAVVEKLDEYLSATQLGITLASLGLGWLGEPAFARLLTPVLSRAGLGEGAVHAVAIALAFSIITFLHIVFGELVPKSLAIQRAEAVSLAVAYPMRLFYFLFYPGIRLLNGVAGLFLRLVGVGVAGEHELAHSEEELRLIVAAMRTHGGIPKERLDLLERALRLPTRTAKDLMVSRGDVAYIEAGMTPAERREIAIRTGHTRYPVVEDDLDHVIGILNLKDLFLRGEDVAAPQKLREVMRDPLYIPESIRAELLLKEFRKKRQHMAIVVDEYGGTAGVITVEDVVAAVVGELQDEFATWGPSIVALPSGTYAVDPTTPVEEFARHFALELPPTEVSTVGGLIMVQLDRVPLTGDKVVFGPLELTVEEMKGPKLVRISARRQKARGAKGP